MTGVKASDRTELTLTGAERAVAVFLPSLADILFISVLTGVLVGLQGRLLGYDGDAGWNLRIGSYILAHGVPRTEFMLSTTYGQPTVYFEWLAQVIFGLALRLGGLNGVVALAAAFVALVTTLLFVAMRQRGIPLALVLALTCAASVLTTSAWTARAQHFSLLLTLLWSEAIWRYWRGGNPRWLWFFPLTMVFWVNLHGGFIGGLALLGTAVAVAWLFPAGRGKAHPRRLTLALAGSLAATLVNPWGPALLPHIVVHLSNPLVMRYTQEFQSPDFHTPSAQLLLLLLLTLTGAWIWLAHARAPRDPLSAGFPGGPEPLAVAQVAIWTVLAMESVRFVPFWAMVATPILGEALTACARLAFASGEASSLTAGRRLLRLRMLALKLATRMRAFERMDRMVGRGLWSGLAVVCIALLVANGGALPGSSARLVEARFDPQVFPVDAAQRLHRDGLPPGRGFTTYTWGSYLDYSLPEYHAFIDSRSDVYSERLMRDYLDIIGLAPNWRQLLDRYQVQWALLPTREPLAQILALSPAWRCVPADGQGVAVLCVRGSAP